MNRSLFFIVVFPLLLSACGNQVYFSCRVSEVSQLGIDHINPVVDALERYKNDSGKYPKNALDLVPQYIDKIPIIINSNENLDDESKYNSLVNEKIRGGAPWIADGGDYFEIKFYSKDDRICLAGGKNNFCEYTSETKKWNCY
jgi:hypothetical protein